MASFFPPCTGRIAFVGDLHGDVAALDAAAASTAAFGAEWLVSVGDLWWRPLAPGHAEFASAVSAVTSDHGIHLLLIDGNNDDAEALTAGRPRDVPLPVSDRFWYAPRGCTWEWEGRKFLGLGGAVTFRRDTKTSGVDLFDGEALTRDDVARACSAGRVDVVVSHDAPAGTPIPGRLLPGPDEDHRLLVATVVEQLQPSLVVHGHYHREYDHRPRVGPHIVGLGRDRDGTSDLCVLDLPALRVVARCRVGAPVA